MSAGGPRWIRRLFRGAAIYGLIMVVPLYFAEAAFVRMGQPPVTHPEFFYGFVSAVVMWQLAYWIIGGDPERYRAIIPLGAGGKLLFGASTVLLFFAGRVEVSTVALVSIDVALAIAFLFAWRRIPVA